MEDSKNLVLLSLKCLALVIMVLISYLLLWAKVATSESSYIATTLDKVALLKRTPSPRLVLVGGSNLAFGVDSAAIRNDLHLGVVNMGLNAGMGLKYMLDQVQPHLRPGDIVVIAPEYEHFVGTQFFGADGLVEVAALTRDLTVLRDMPLMTLGTTVLNLNGTIFNYKPMKSSGVMTGTRSGFNGDGDEVAHLTLSNRVFADNGTLSADVNKKALKYLHTFIASNRARGVDAVVVHPCIEKTYYSLNVRAIDTIASAIKDEGINPLSMPSDFVFDDDLFFNSVYHLNAQGRRLRTQKMVQILKGPYKKGAVAEAATAYTGG